MEQRTPTTSPRPTAITRLPRAHHPTPGARRLLCTVGLSLIIAVAFAGCGDDEVADPGPGMDGTLQLADFASNDACRACHPDQVAQWEGSMHAYSMSDPVWFAILQNEWAATDGSVDQFCIQCHSPIGFLTGTTPRGFTLEALPGIVREGITCTVCHSMEQTSLAVDDDGAVYHLDPTGPQRGGLPDPVETGAHASLSSAQFSRSSACLPCHDLYINGLSAEVTYTEWVGSPYAPMGIECQECHMPEYVGQAAVGGPMRRVHDHRMIGVDIPLVDFPHAEETRARVADLLDGAVTAEILGPDTIAAGDSLVFDVRVSNRSGGHSIPSGASFLREMWLRVVVRSAMGDVLLESGMLDAMDNLVDDPWLHTFQSTVTLAGGSLTTLDSIDNSPLIPALGSRRTTYGVRIPEGTPGPLVVDVAVLFRSFAPATLRGLGLDAHVDAIKEPMVMESLAGAVAVTP